MSDIQEQFDLANGEAFAGTLLTTLNNGALCLMLSIGHRTGLFDASTFQRDRHFESD